MIYLPDVNALLALGHSEHTFHHRVAAWTKAENFPTLLTCSVTELGFVRILPQIAPGLSVSDSRALLLDMKTGSRLVSFSFLADNNDVSQLPAWVKTPKQTTDGHLLALARAHGAVLATLDERIPGAYLIPQIN